MAGESLGPGKPPMIEPDDWRLANQMDYLRDAVLFWKEYKAPCESWDHDHCEFCLTKFMERGTQVSEGEIEHSPPALPKQITLPSAVAR